MKHPLAVVLLAFATACASQAQHRTHVTDFSWETVWTRPTSADESAEDRARDCRSLPFGVWAIGSKGDVVGLIHEPGSSRAVEPLRERGSGEWQGDKLHLDCSIYRFQGTAAGQWVRAPDTSVYDLRFTGGKFVGTRNGEPIVLIPCP